MAEGGEESMGPGLHGAPTRHVRGLVNIRWAEVFHPEPHAEGNAPKYSGGGFSEHGVGIPA